MEGKDFVKRKGDKLNLSEWIRKEWSRQKINFPDNVLQKALNKFEHDGEKFFDCAEDRWKRENCFAKKSDKTTYKHIGKSMEENQRCVVAWKEADGINNGESLLDQKAMTFQSYPEMFKAYRSCEISPRKRIGVETVPPPIVS